MKCQKRGLPSTEHIVLQSSNVFLARMADRKYMVQPSGPTMVKDMDNCYIFKFSSQGAGGFTFFILTHAVSVLHGGSLLE